MKNHHIIAYLLLVISLIFAVSSISASQYIIEFNQIAEKLIVTETINQVQTTLEATEELDQTKTGYYFIQKIVSKDNFDNFSIILRLEPGVTAQTNEIFPQGYQTKTDGQEIVIQWDYYNVKTGNVFAFFVSLEDQNKNENYLWAYLIITIILAAAIFSSYRYLNHKRKDISRYLLDDEKRVIKLLKEAEGKSLWQKNIQSTLEFSKAKLSRMIRNLESRSLIEKISIGNTNKIRLK